MIKHGISVDAANQVSLLPAEVVANNIIAISNVPGTLNETFHITRDDYTSMREIMAEITRQTGRQFNFFSLRDFVPEVIRRCTPQDPLFLLLDFLKGSIENIASMEFKRYNNDNYRAARAAARLALPDPSLEQTVSGILRFLAEDPIAGPDIPRWSRLPRSSTLGSGSFSA
jgi:hypothetical protein